jgi:hypothetical protein
VFQPGDDGQAQRARQIASPRSRVPSMSRTRSASVSFRSAAMARRWTRKGSSKLTLVLCRMMTTENFLGPRRLVARVSVFMVRPDG